MGIYIFALFLVYVKHTLASYRYIMFLKREFLTTLGNSQLDSKNEIALLLVRSITLFFSKPCEFPNIVHVLPSRRLESSVRSARKSWCKRFSKPSLKRACSSTGLKREFGKFGTRTNSQREINKLFPCEALVLWPSQAELLVGLTHALVGGSACVCRLRNRSKLSSRGGDYSGYLSQGLQDTCMAFQQVQYSSQLDDRFAQLHSAYVCSCSCQIVHLISKLNSYRPASRGSFQMMPWNLPCTVRVRRLVRLQVYHFCSSNW